MKIQNKIITIEIHHHIDKDKNFGNTSEFFNFRVKDIRLITDRQRTNFKKDNQTGNISELKFLMLEIEKAIKQSISEKEELICQT